MNGWKQKYNMINFLKNGVVCWKEKVEPRARKMSKEEAWQNIIFYHIYIELLGQQLLLI